MLVDKSHSKKDIVTLFKKHGVIIDDKLSKGNIIKDIDFYMKDFKFNNNINNETELKDYLKNISPKQRPNTQIKKGRVRRPSPLARRQHTMAERAA